MWPQRDKHTPPTNPVSHTAKEYRYQYKSTEGQRSENGRSACPESPEPPIMERGEWRPDIEYKKEEIVTRERKSFTPCTHLPELDGLYSVGAAYAATESHTSTVRTPIRPQLG